VNVIKTLPLVLICSALIFLALVSSGRADSVIDELQETQESNNQERFDDAEADVDAAEDALSEANSDFDKSPEAKALKEQSQENDDEYIKAKDKADDDYKDSKEATAKSDRPEITDEWRKGEREAALDKASKKWSEERDRIDKEREKARKKAIADEEAALNAAYREYTAAKKAMEDFKQAIKDAEERTGLHSTTPQAPIITPAMPIMPNDGGMSGMSSPPMEHY
jgi:hypothetical protein